MKILAIRGCNLASLAGEFEIDLAHGPLGAAGVFAIVGPTGAGKSTLLDAMCVALFDRTPRLPGHSRVTVGHGEEDPLALGAQDPRTLLRRGASQGWAEVDFESGDTRRYRARWSVRRARGATDGNLQDQQVTLTAIASPVWPGGAAAPNGGAESIAARSVITERLGGTKTETLKAIHQRLGLTFDQFRRSALLAQGDFAAFLRAEGKDRSELLERMTGTEIYSKLSIAAHARAVQAEQMLRERHAAAHAIYVLDEATRTHTIREAETAKLAREAARHLRDDAEKLAHWRAEAVVRASSLAQAESEHAIAEAEARGAEPVRSELVVRRRAEALRGIWDEASRLDRQHSIAQGELARAAVTAEEAELTKREIGATRARISELHAMIREARLAAAIVEIGSPARGAPTGRGVSSAAPQPLAHRAISPDLVAEAEQRGLAALAPATWLVERRALAPEIAAWPELEAKLVQDRTLVDGIAAADRVLSDQAAQRRTLAEKEAAVQAASELARHKLQAATREAESFVKRRTLGLDAASRAEDEARTHCSDVDRLVAISHHARGAANVLAELGTRLRDLEVEATHDRERRTGTDRERAAAAVRRDERARVAGELRKAAGFEHARAELVEGEPCPLCGAADHPWKHKGAFDALIADAERALAEATARWEAATKLIAQLDARELQREAERARFANTRATAQTSADSLARDWTAQLAALGELSLVTDPATPTAEQLATERAEAARARLETARATRSAAEAAHKAVAEAQARVQVCQADLDHHLAELRELAAALAAISVAVERLAAERVARVDRHAELARDLAAIASRWYAALPIADRAELGFVAEAASAKPMKRARAKPAATVDAGPRDGPAQIDRTPGPSAAPGACAGRPRGPSTPVGETLGAAQIDRARFADLVQAWRERAAAVAYAEACLIAALAEIDRAGLASERAVADTAARHAECAKRSRQLAAELVAASTALDAARLAAGFERAALHRALADDASRVDVLATELERLDRAVDRARTRIAERKRLVLDHEALRPVSRLVSAAGPGVPHLESSTRAMSPSELAAAAKRDADRVAELAATVKQADHHAAALAATLAADDDARKRRAEALDAFAAAERAAEVDRVLGQVIGSHDGKLFRSFAQSLTLDQLLGVANSHLEELAPRYQLERVPKHDLELQVIDRDFGGEVRSVQSLSGGESFLVSLALALGLSSMSAHDVRVRTLLIDEGFGTLDPATLDSALAVLDELQATGRQVGIISHVPALLDRVRAHVRVTPRGGGRSDVQIPAS
jgi:exonuclease SbcC